MEIKVIQAIKLDTLMNFEIELQIDDYETHDEIIISTILPEITISKKGEYYFATFQQFRDQLLDIGIGLKCAGSLLNVCQSHLASYTEKIYIIKLGEQAKADNIVCIFDYMDLDKFSHTLEQEEFYQKWITSLV